MSATAPPSVWLDRRSPPGIVTLVLIAGVAALSMNVFLPSLPAIAAWYGSDYAVVQLAVSGYLGLTGALQLVIGPMSDRYGRRVVVIASLCIFLVATIGCVYAPNVETFLAFRLLQAAVASGIVLSRAIVRDICPPEKAASMIGYVTMGMALMPMVGPMIGGVLEGFYGWQAGFWLLFGFGAAVLVLVLFDLGETNTNMTASFGAQFRAYPALFRSRRFWGYAATTAFASGAFFSFLGGGPYVGREILGMSPEAFGAHFAFIAGGYMTGNFISGRFGERIGMMPMILMGTGVAACGMALSMGLFGMGLGSPAALFGPVFFVGLGNGMTLPSATVGMMSVRPDLAGSASGIGGALMIGGGAVLSAITGAMLDAESGAWPLLLMMFGSSVLGFLSALGVRARERQLARQGAQ